MLLFKPAKPDRHFDPFVQTDSIKIKQETQNSLNRPAGLTTGEVSVGKIPANSNTVVASAEVHTQHYDAELTETLPNKGTHPIQIPDFIQQIQLPQSLDEQTPTKQSIFSQDTHKTELITPIKLDRLKHFLTGYSDKEFLVYGFQRGFHLGYSVSNPSHRITLTKESRKDLKAWQIFVDNFNGKLLLPEHRWVTSDSLHFHTDASGSFGYGAVFKTHWFYGPWQDHQLSNGITWKELFPIVLAIDGPPCQLLAANSWRFLFAHICRNSLFIICSLQNSSYCLLSTISGIFTINALLQQPCVPFHFDKQASFATSTPTNFCLQNHKCFLRQVKDFMV